MVSATQPVKQLFNIFCVSAGSSVNSDKIILMMPLKLSWLMLAGYTLLTKSIHFKVLVWSLNDIDTYQVGRV